MNSWLFPIAVGMAAIAGAVAAAPPAELLIAPAAGEVRLVPPGSARDPLALAAWQAVEGGQKARLGAGARALLLCLNGPTCNLAAGPAEVAADFCTKPAGPPCQEAPRDLPQQRPALATDGRGYYLQGSLDLIGNPRGERPVFGAEPVLLSPRCPETAVSPDGCQSWLAPPDEILFAATNGAKEYTFRLRSFDRPRQEAVFPAAGLTCAAARPELPGLRICRVAWPAAFTLPSGGGRANLEISADGRASPAKARLAVRPGAPPRPRLAPSQEILLLPTALDLLRQGLPSEVAALLATRGELAPQLHLALGEAFLATDLPELAREHFRLAAPAGASRLLRAEAALGGARSELELSQLEEAAAGLAVAEKLYRELSLDARLTLVEELRRFLPVPKKAH